MPSGKPIQLPDGLHRARWIVPVSTPPIEGGVLRIHDGTIVAIESFHGQADVVDHGDVAMLPQLVNAHTHLEFSSLEEPLGSAGKPFTEWIRDVLAFRISRDSADSTAVERAVRRGLDESQQAGVGFVGEIATVDALERPFAESATGGVRFLELIGLGDERVAQQLARAEKFLQGHDVGEAAWQRGLSPHAPYTAAPDLISACARLSQSHRIPIAMHLGETPEELELLASGSGPFRELLEERGVWNGAAFEAARRPLDYLKWLSSSHRLIAVHGNYFERPEWEYLGQHADRMSVAYWPRTHDYFGHDIYPLAKMLSAGVAVCVGTDSRSSNPDLNLWDDLRFIASSHSDVSPEKIIQMGTILGADALGLADRAGQLAVGRLSSVFTIRLESETGSVYDLLLE